MNKRIFFSIIIISTLAACGGPAHIYHNIPSNFRQINHTNEIPVLCDTSIYTGYYRIICRDENKTQEIADLSNIDSENIHITDIQYFLIDWKNNKYIQFTYMPVRNASKSVKSKTVDGDVNKYIGGNYLDALKSDYNNKINIYNLNNIYYGNISENYFIYTFGDGEENRYLHFTEQGNNTIVLDKVFYPGKKVAADRELDLIQLFDIRNCTFYKMDSFDLVLKTAENKIYDIDEAFTLATYKNSHTFIKKNVNAIVFTYIVPQGIYTNFYFRQRRLRFEFQYPPY